MWDYIKNLGNLKKGVKINHAEVSYFDANEVQLQSTDPCGIEADGEYVGFAPATISIWPKALRFLMAPNIL
jgi:diacylglycerol kinase family enzyme